MRKGRQGYIGSDYRKIKKRWYFMKQYQKKLDQLYTEFSSGENGLSTEQAVKTEKFGRNVITEARKNPFQ